MGFKNYFTEATNNDVIAKFFDNDKLKDGGGAGNLLYQDLVNGYALLNYSTPLLYKDNKGKKYVCNTDKFSSTTSKIQKLIQAAAKERGIRLEEVDTNKIEDIIEREN